MEALGIPLRQASAAEPNSATLAIGESRRYIQSSPLGKMSGRPEGVPGAGVSTSTGMF